MHKVQETLPDSLPVFVSKFPKPKRLRKKKKEICGCGQQWPESMLCEPTANINNEAQKANTHSLSIPPPPPNPPCEIGLEAAIVQPSRWLIIAHLWQSMTRRGLWKDTQTEKRKLAFTKECSIPDVPRVTLARQPFVLKQSILKGRDGHRPSKIRWQRATNAALGREQWLY